MAVTLADFATYLGVVSTDAKYAQLQGVLDATNEYVTARWGSFGVSSAHVVRPTGATLVLPVVGVSAVSAISDPDGTAVVVADCDVNLAAGVVTLPSWPSVVGGYTVTVTLGASKRADEAVKIIGRHLWETRRGNQGAATSAFASDMEPVPSGFAIPRRAEQLMAGLGAPGFA